MVSVEPQRLRSFDRLRHPNRGTSHLYLVRHGQTAGNVDHRLIGHTDMPLDDLGLQQARQVGERLRSTRLDAVVSSPLQRARVTAGEIARHQHLEPAIDHRLKEMHFGDAEGLTIAEAVVRFPDIMRLRTDPFDEHFAWPGGDIRSQFHAAVFATFIDLAVKFQDQHVAVVCHGGVIGSLVAQLDGGSPNDYATYPIANCSVTHLEVHADGTTAHLVNDICHLDAVRTEPFTFTTPNATGTTSNQG
jgi:broad specificity phosphatase PhoE